MPETDTYGRHEILHMSMVIANMIDRYLIDHKGMRDDEEKLALAADTALNELYQLIGSRHIGEE